MKEKLELNGKNIDKLAIYKELKSKKYYISREFKSVLSSILEVNNNIEIKNIKDNEFIVTSENNILCYFKIRDSYSLDYCMIDITIDNVLYEYCINKNQKGLTITLIKYFFVKNETFYNVTRYDSNLIIDIKKSNKGISLELEDKLAKNEVIELITDIKLDSSIDEIYDKVNNKIATINNLKMKKYLILNTCDLKEMITDLIIVEDANLVDYLVTIKKENRKYIIKKEGNNYSFTLVDASIDDFISAYFDINSQVKFIKKLEKKKEKK